MAKIVGYGYPVLRNVYAAFKIHNDLPETVLLFNGYSRSCYDYVNGKSKLKVEAVESIRRTLGFIPVRNDESVDVRAYTNLLCPGMLTSDYTVYLTQARARSDESTTNDLRKLYARTGVTYEVSDRIEVETTLLDLLESPLHFSSPLPVAARQAFYVKLQFDRKELKNVLESTADRPTIWVFATGYTRQ